MTKGIIINGVDVTACQNYNRRTEKCKIPCWINNIKCTGLNCSDIKDCYFKQLKRKEQECDHWKNQCLCLDGEDVTVQIAQEQFEEYQKLKEENPELLNENQKRAENLITNPESEVLDSIKRAKIKTDISKTIEELVDNV